MSRKQRLIALVVTVTVLAAACGSSKSSSSSGASNAAPGVTATQITVGNVATLTGPVPGLFQGAQFGTSAYFDYINSQGGVNGRKLVLKTGDDSLNCAQAQSQTQDLVGQVFAFVGSFSVFDNCAAKVFTANPNVANISYALTPDANTLPNNYSIEPRPPGDRTGPFKYYKSKFPDSVKAVGAVFSATAQDAWNQEKGAMESVGYHIAYERGAQSSESDFTADVLRMRDAKVDFIFMSDMNIKQMTNMLNEMQQQGYKPTVRMTAGSAYDGNFFKLVAPGAAEGMFTDMQYETFLDPTTTQPETKLFQEQMKKSHPSFQLDLFAVFSWASATLFVQALKNAGKNPTQASLTSALKAIHNFDANGIVASADPGAKTPPECWILIQAHNNDWQRVTPDKGFECNPGGYFFYKG